jgi:outer membrane biosynthesis protein TonB
MEYQQAKNLRGKKFTDLMTEKLLEGQGVGSSLVKTISEKSKARMTGFKEAFDPMNIAKKLTLGSNLAPAIYGSLFGRSQEDMKYFTAGKSAKAKTDVAKSPSKLEHEGNDMAVQVLGLIYRLMQRDEEDKKLDQEQTKSNLEEKESEEERRNKQIIEAIVGRKAKKPTKKKAKEPGKKEEVTEKPAPTEKPEVFRKSPRRVKPTEVSKPTPKVTTVKPEVVTKAPSISTATKIGIGAVAIGAPIGALSAQFESSKSGAAAIGYDSTGGTSYGTYQLASKKGVVKEFLDYMYGINPEWTKKLSVAGEANTGSTKGSFPDAWKAIAAENPKEFGKIQHDFIELKHYQPTVKALAKINYDVESQPAAIKDVVWSTAVQHGSGGAASIFKQAIQQAGGVDAKPEKIISNVYEIRRTKFGSSTDAVRASVNRRFDTESRMAMEMLNDSGSKINQASKENKDLRDSLDKTKTNQTTTNNTYAETQSKETKKTNEVSDDTNAYLKKTKG